MKGVFQDVFLAVDNPVLLAIGQLGADAGGGVEGADSRAGGSDPLRKSSLGDKLPLSLARVVQFFEVSGLGWMWRRRKGADDLSHPARLDERPQVHAMVEGARSRMVGDRGKVRRALSQEGGDEIPANPGTIMVEPSETSATASSKLS